MSMLVIVQTKASFRSWLRKEEANAREPATAAETAGQNIFLATCSSCHTIRGTSASGYVGPDLTHVGSRQWLAGLAFENRPDVLASWITDSQHIKPGNEMPNIDVSGTQLRDLVSYLESLK
jgi:cytochrome c oxidase subunit 2